MNPYKRMKEFDKYAAALPREIVRWAIEETVYPTDALIFAHQKLRFDYSVEAIKEDFMRECAETTLEEYGPDHPGAVI